MDRNSIPRGEGYHIFKATVNEDVGYEKALTMVQDQINEAEKDFEMTFLSGPSVKDSPDSRAVSVAFQAAVLKKRKK